MKKPIRLLLLEDDAPTRARLCAALLQEPDFLVAEAASLAEARAALGAGAPDILISDLNLPDGHALSLIGEAHARFPAMEILVISVLSDEATVVAAIAAGASGYVLKDALPEDIAGTVRQVLQGHSPVSTGIARYILRQLRNTESPPEEHAAKLTRREIDILWGIAKGLSYNEIADGLGISRNTVPNYIKSIYRKLEVNSRGEAVFEAVSRKLITL